MRQIDISRAGKFAGEAAELQSAARTAILIIHGIGQQNPLETLDQFARGLKRSLDQYYKPDWGGEYSVTHRQVNYCSPQLRELWFENYIALEAEENMPAIDVYEYYWAHHMTGEADVSDIVDWLKEVSSYARRYYQKNPKKPDGEGSGVKHGESARLKNLFEPSGEFHENGYLRNFGLLLRLYLVVYDYLKDSVFRGWPFIRMLFDFVSRKLNRLIVDYFGDVVVYTTMDRKARHYDIRNKILRHGRLEIEALLSNEDYDSVIIAGHSLGSVIAYDLLSRLHVAPVAEDDAEEWQRALLKIRGLITFGSPLDKIAFFFRQQVGKNAYIHRQMLNNLHGFKKSPLDDPDYDPGMEEFSEVKNEVVNNLDHVKWINYFDRQDPVSGHLDLYKVDKNRQLEMNELFGVAHVKYWDFDEMYIDMLEFLGNNNIIPVEAKAKK